MNDHSRLPTDNLEPAIRWRSVLVSLATSLIGTGLIGGILLLVGQSMWWVLLGGSASIFVSGFYMGRRTGEPDPLSGSLLAVLYFSLLVVVLFLANLAEEELAATLQLRLDPLPGLAIGDSTFYFVSPLLVLVSGVAGSVLGGQIAGHRVGID